MTTNPSQHVATYPADHAARRADTPLTTATAQCWTGRRCTPLSENAAGSPGRDVPGAMKTLQVELEKIARDELLQAPGRSDVPHDLYVVCAEIALEQN
eukprot:gene25158-11994_t